MVTQEETDRARARYEKATREATEALRLFERRLEGVTTLQDPEIMIAFNRYDEASVRAQKLFAEFCRLMDEQYAELLKGR